MGYFIKQDIWKLIIKIYKRWSWSKEKLLLLRSRSRKVFCGGQTWKTEIDFTRCTTIASRLWMASMTAGWVSVQSLINSGFQLNPRQGKKSTLNGTFGDQSSGWQCSDKTRTNKYIWYKRENHQTKRTFLILKQKPVSLLERSPEGGRFSILPFWLVDHLL